MNFSEDDPDTKYEPIQIACPVGFGSKPVESTSIQQMLDDLLIESSDLRNLVA